MDRFDILTPRALDLPTFNLRGMHQAARRGMAAAAEEYGAFVVQDQQNYDPEVHCALLDALEQFGQLPHEIQRKYIRPHFQAGWMPAEVETARDAHEWEATLSQGHRPLPHTGPNNYGRWFHRPNVLGFDGVTDPDLLPQNVTVDEIDGWGETMEAWGTGMMKTIIEVAHNLALGWSLPVECFENMLRGGHNIVGATVTDLEKYGRSGCVHAHRHYDFNALTGHDGSRFRVLIIWTRDGTPMLVKVPPGHRLIQVGRMLEHVTGGRALRGYHQTATLPETTEDMMRAIQYGRPLIRGSATFFAAFRADITLEPLERFRTKAAVQQYPPLPCMELIRGELDAIKMKTGEWSAGD